MSIDPTSDAQGSLQPRRPEDSWDRTLFGRLIELGLKPGWALIECSESAPGSPLQNLSHLYCTQTLQVSPGRLSPDLLQPGSHREDATSPGAETALVLRSLDGIEQALAIDPGLLAIQLESEPPGTMWDSLCHRMSSVEWFEHDGLRALILRRSRPAGQSSSHALAQELRAYDQCNDVHDLPPIYHYWSDRVVRPLFEQLGFTDLHDFLLTTIRIALEQTGQRRIVSLGAGNCDLEIDLARRLRERGADQFRFDCLELNPNMVRRAQIDVRAAGLEECISVQTADLADWHDDTPAAVCLANHSLHHLVELEALFSQIRRVLGRRGRLVVNDMIGRNGHMRWPEALIEVERIWRDLPARYKFQHQLAAQHDAFVNWDCAQEGYEGVRAQDILPLLLEEFRCETFVAFGNLIDVFVDRGYGHNFSPEHPEDVAWIDRITARDEELLDQGAVKPTHLVAAFANFETNCRSVGPRTPESCIRWPDEPYRRCGEARFHPPGSRNGGRGPT